MPPIIETLRTETWENGELVAVEETQVDVTEERNEETIRGRADTALADLRTLRDTTGSLSSANLSNAVRLLARVAIVLIRLQLRRLDEAD